jgi:hypothetical protein
MTDVNDLPAHSKLRASGAEQWMNCPGSVSLLQMLKLDPSDEPDYRADGVLAHSIAAKCLETKTDAWEYMDDKFTDELSIAVQTYIDYVRPLMFQASSIRIEQRMYRPDLHPDFFGTADLALYFAQDFTLDVTDYKNGEGIVVEVEWNPQIMYYAYGLLDQYPEAQKIKLRIVQPRAYHPDGPIREWEISREHLEVWAREGLLPAMQRAEMDRTLDVGEWCRFCPAKLICPAMRGLFGAAIKADPQHVQDLTDASLGRDYQRIQGVKFYIAAVEQEAHNRLQKGTYIGNAIKLVAKRANRVLKSGAEVVFKARFGANAYTSPELKSPPQLEMLGGDAKALVKEWAYSPLTGTTVALASDKREAIKVQSGAEVFANVVEEAKTAAALKEELSQ